MATVVTVLANGCPRSGTRMLLGMLERQGLRRAPGIVKSWYDGHLLAYRSTPGAPIGSTTLDDLAAQAGMVCHAHVYAGVALPRGLMVVTIFRDPRPVVASYAHEWCDGDVLTALRRFCGRSFVGVYRGFLGWRQRGPWVRFEDLADRTADWRSAWTSVAEREWRAQGGPDLLAEAGYS